MDQEKFSKGKNLSFNFSSKIFLARKKHKMEDNLEQNCTIFISNINPHSNHIKPLLHHFSEFGAIKSIWSYGTKACVTYENHESAIKAVKSPNAYESNRFIKIEIHKNPTKAMDNLMADCYMEKVRKKNAKVQKMIEEQKRTTELLKQSIKESISSESGQCISTELELEIKKLTNEVKLLMEKHENEDDPKKKGIIMDKIRKCSALLDSLNSIPHSLSALDE